VALPVAIRYEGGSRVCGSRGIRTPPAPVRSQQLLRGRLADAGLIVSGASPDGQLAEIMEMEDHPFFVGVQFHPEFRSRPTNPHPLFRDFIAAAKEALPEGSQRELPLDEEDEVLEESFLEDRVLAVTHE
jgi:hypothetical protein